MKTLIARRAALALLAWPFLLFGQNFQRQFGTPFGDFFTKTIQHGTDFYVLGGSQPTPGSSALQATVSRIDKLGELQWTTSLNTPSTWSDAVVTPSGNLLLVGSAVKNGDSKSMIGLLAPTGAFVHTKIFDTQGSDLLEHIVRNPVPDDAAFPYYVGGTQSDANQDIMLLNMSEAGVFKWKKHYPNPVDDHLTDLEVLPGGNLLLLFSGTFNGKSTIFLADNKGEIFSASAVSDLPDFYWQDLTPAIGGGFYAISYGNKILAKFDEELLPIWEKSLPGLQLLEIEQSTAGEFFTTEYGAVTTGLGRTSIQRFSEVGGVVSLLSSKYFENGQMSGGRGYVAALSGGKIAFVDNWVPAAGGFGQVCAFMSVTDANSLPSCMTLDNGPVSGILPTALLYDAPIPPAAISQTLPLLLDIPTVAANWQQADACPKPCQAAFSVQVGPCGQVNLVNQSTGVAPISNQWSNGAATANQNLMLPCGPHTYCLSITDATGCMSSVCHTFQAGDVQPPTIICPEGQAVVGTINAAGICTATISNLKPTITDNCQGPTALSHSINNGPVVAGDASGAVFQSGVNSITYLATDACGNSASCVFTVEVGCPTFPNDTSCCAYALYLVNERTDGKAKKVRVSAMCETLICCADPDDYDVYGQNLTAPNFVEWSLLDGSGFPTGNAIDNDFMIYLKKNSGGAHDLLVEWFDAAGAVFCRHQIQISCDGPFEEDEDWTLFTQTTALDDPQLFVLAVREDEDDDESDCEEEAFAKSSSCLFSFGTPVCSGGNSYVTPLNGPSGFDTYNWSVQIGPAYPGIASGQNSSVTLPAAGSYVILLQASSSSETCDNTQEIIIPLISADFEAKLLPCPMVKTYQFTASGWENASDITSVSWVCVGQPTFPATGTTVNFAFSTAQMYTITMTVMDKYGCSHQITKNVDVNFDCKPAAEVEKFVFCEKDCQGVQTKNVAVTFNNNSSGGACPVNYTWDFGDGTPVVADNGTTVTHTYAVPCPNGKMYSVTLTMNDAASCNKTAVFTADITPCEVDFTYVACPDGRVNFMSNVPGKWAFTGSIGIAPWPYSEIKDKRGNRSKVVVRYPAGTFGVSFTGRCESGGECTITKEIVVMLDCCAKNDREKDKGYFNVASTDYKWKWKFAQNQAPLFHQIKAVTKLKKKKSKKGHGFWRGTPADEIESSFAGNIWRRDPVTKCNCEEIKAVSQVPGPEFNKKKAKAKEFWVFKRFRSRFDSMTSTHRMIVGSTAIGPVTLKLGNDCDEFHWWTDWY